MAPIKKSDHGERQNESNITYTCRGCTNEGAVKHIFKLIGENKKLKRRLGEINLEGYMIEHENIKLKEERESLKLERESLKEEKESLKRKLAALEAE